MFDSKVAVLVHEDLPMWQKLNVTAFLATGIAAAVPQALGAPYEDAAGRFHAPLLGQPILVFAASTEVLQRAWQQSIQRDLQRSVYARGMFETGHDAANRAVFLAEPADAPDLVGLGLYGPKKDVDKASKGARLHP
ncbi:MAG: DUF2000 domain-containing protein [Comamonadaceae bacterium]|nr:MAG: DUF2000 domain-containing protein [Comamonadaceae bacterium]